MNLSRHVYNPILAGHTRRLVGDGYSEFVIQTKVAERQLLYTENTEEGKNTKNRF
jgi:hypothetical protein